MRYVLFQRLFIDILEAGAVVVIFVHYLVPHGGGADPQALFTLESPIDNHRFHGLRVAGRAEVFVEIAFEMTVFSGHDFHKYSSKRTCPGKFPGHKCLN